MKPTPNRDHWDVWGGGRGGRELFTIEGDNILR